MVSGKHHTHLLFAVIYLLTLLTKTTGASQAQIVGGTIVKTITLGIVSERPREKIEQHSPFVNYLAQKLSSTSDIKGRVVVAPTASELAKLINEKGVDFYTESPFPTFLINEQTGAKLLLRSWKGGLGEYRSLILTTKRSGITGLEDLLGKIIAFEDPGSTSGYFLPKVLLHRKGFKLTEKSSFEANVSSKEIGYLFSHGHENILNWVLLRKVAAGALSNNDFDKLDEKMKKEFVILGETEAFPRYLLSVRKDLDPAFVSRIKEILLAMHQTQEGQRILEKTDKITKFDRLPGGEQMMYQKIRELFGLFQSR